MSSLHQFRIEFVPAEDRLLFRMSTTDGSEVRLWFTRRLVKRAWPLLNTLLERDPQVVTQSDPLARRSVVAFQRDAAVAQTDFSKKYETGEARTLPLGDAPVLVTKLSATPTGNGHRLSFAPDKGNVVNITLNAQYLHSFCHLLQQAVGKADWDLAFGQHLETPADQPRRLM